MDRPSTSRGALYRTSFDMAREANPPMDAGDLARKAWPNTSVCSRRWTGCSTPAGGEGRAGRSWTNVMQLLIDIRKELRSKRKNV